ncbi:hypothetical protein [Falsibacillus pallidus]|uniref:Uncharacterized protein n=1 Tax=Falsibacillus pallidus TaxID=493781 RepID=A0A370GQV2_9BACI|nr:hypothetical protein [Falsibacillus pallidus]RDI45789.1 hypothetical protein DFR59_102423 [Falsibacillus pallidus]
MLTFEEKQTLIEKNFPQLTKKDVSLKRVNYHFEDSAYEKSNVVYHLHPNGNGFVYGGLLKGYPTDDRGMINIREFSAEELMKVIKESIDSLSWNEKNTREAAIVGEAQEERWINDEGHELILVEEDEWWNIYDGLNLEAAYGSYDEAEDYLLEERFKRS